MTARVACFAVAFLIAASGQSAAQGISLLGTWEIVEARPAPWVEESKHAPLIAHGKRMIGQTVTFTSREVTSKYKPLACKRAQYENTNYEADAIFQGNLPEPNPTAAAVRLGFKKGETAGVDLRCTSGSYSYHFRDRGTALTALSNVIYTLKRM